MVVDWKKIFCSVNWPNEGLWGPLRWVTYVPNLNFKTSHFMYTKEVAMLLSVFYCQSFNLSLRRLLPFLLFYVPVSRPFHLLKFYPSWALAVGMHGHHVLLGPVLVKNHQNILKRYDVNIPLFSAIWAPPAAIKWTLPSWRTPEITCRTSEISSSVRHITFMAFWKKKLKSV